MIFFPDGYPSSTHILQKNAFFANFVKVDDCLKQK